jgi:heme-degrading monooxygenase HmoA
MEGDAYTLAMWRVRPGQEEEFIRAWREDLAGYFLSLPGVMGGTLLRCVEDPSLFYSFGPWRSLEDIQSMRADPRTTAVMGKLRDLCVEATPGVYERVLTLGQPA